MHGLSLIRSVGLIMLFGVTASAQPHGLKSRPEFAAFHDNRLPPNAATVAGDWSTVVTFPNLTFLNPMGVLPIPDTTGLSVWKRERRIYSFENNATTSTKTLVLDIHNRVQGWDDSGLMGVAFHPQFATNRYIFLAYTYLTPGNVKGDMHTRPDTCLQGVLLSCAQRS